MRLSDPECLDPSLAGGKAARLAQARAAGLPVLPGLVVPAQRSVPALREALSRPPGGGPHGMRLAIMEADVDELAALPEAAAELGSTLVVRSSSPVEGTARWSGAFTSLLDVRPEEVLTAVRAVWASAADESARRDGLDPAALGMAVLIQPQVEPDFSGTTEIDDTGLVTVVVVAGSPAPLVAGWDPGQVARCRPHGSVAGEGAVALAGEKTLRAVADLARALYNELGDNLVEWAVVDGQVLLLQSKLRIERPADARPTHSPTHLSAELPEYAASVAHRALRHAGPTGERLVLPWLLAGVPAAETPVRPARTDDLLTAWEDAVRLAEELTAEAWPDADDPRGEADRTLAALRGDRTAEALRRLHALPRVHPARAAEALALFGRIAHELADAGALAQPRHLWALSPEDVSPLLTGDLAADPQRAAHHHHRAALRWEPFAYAAVMNEGEQVSGVPASPGTGAGPVVFVDGPPQHTALPPRAVIVAARPLPHLAPLLWGASALVTFGGSVAAHLVEVARSLAVPAAVGCPAEELVGPHGPALAAVDGDDGLVAMHTAVG